MWWDSSLALLFVVGYLCAVGIVCAACSSWWLGRHMSFVLVLVVAALVVMGGSRDPSGGFRTSLVARG